MHVNKVDQTTAKNLLDPISQGWNQSVSDGVQVGLSPAPIGLQPTMGVRAAFENKKYGLIESATFQAVHDGKNILVRVSWKDSNKDHRVKDNDSFVDQMALMFPLTENSTFITMGSMLDPVELWRWKADQAEPQQIRAKGYGTTRNIEDDMLFTKAVWDVGEWNVVLKRKMITPSKDSANFHTGETQRCSLAVWAGHNKERAGIKSISMKWIPMIITPI